jgi:hypothetical protein
VLLYAPDDRALQEWFIETSKTAPDELRRLYDAINLPEEMEAWLTHGELSRRTGMPEVKLNVALAELEGAAAVEHLGDEGVQMLLRGGTWNMPAITAAIVSSKQHIAHRKKQLDKMVAYAESNTCRRQILLAHFGDNSHKEVHNCCDNCSTKATKSTTVGVQPRKESTDKFSTSQVALVILDAVRRLKIKVGREKLSQILKGSQARAMRQFGYDKSTYYGRFEIFSQEGIEGMIDQLIENGDLKVVGGEYPVLSLTPQGIAVLQEKADVPLKLPRQLSPKFTNKKAVQAAGGTVAYTVQLLRQGCNPDQIAVQRGLASYTIFNHLSQAIAAGEVELDSVVPGEVRAQVESAIRQVGSVENLTPLKLVLPDEIGYGVIRCVVEAWKRTNTPASGSSHSDTSGNATPDTDSAVESFLTSLHPRQLPGPWSEGWALGFHSSFSGSAWNRSPVGELAYRLKYQGDLTALPALLDQTVALLETHPILIHVDAIVPVPSSIARTSDPVRAFAETLAGHFDLKVLPVVVKTRKTEPQKEFHTRAQKRSNVTGAFTVQGPIHNLHLLVVDDLFDSGMTLEEITRVLQRAGAASVCVLTLTRTIHSDA